MSKRFVLGSDLDFDLNGSKLWGKNNNKTKVFRFFSQRSKSDKSQLKKSFKTVSKGIQKSQAFPRWNLRIILNWTVICKRRWRNGIFVPFRKLLRKMMIDTVNSLSLSHLRLIDFSDVSRRNMMQKRHLAIFDQKPCPSLIKNLKDLKLKCTKIGIWTVEGILNGSKMA